MADVFVSYKTEDRRRVKPLVDALVGEGFTVWWDTQIGSGAAWRHAIETELNAAKCVIVVWSKHSAGLEGAFVQDEASRAQQRRVYVPVTIDKVVVPLGFGETQATSLAGWTGNRTDARFQSVLEAVRLHAGGAAPSHGSVRHSAPLVSRRLSLAAGASLAAAGLAGGWFVLRPKSASAQNRIAVLPFANLSGDPSQAYFSDGIAEELRSSLSRVGLQVIGRTSSAAVKDLDTKAAAAKLGVANILTGSVRRSPETIRIDAQLVSGSDGVERWAQSYDRAPGDAIKIQTDIAENVAQALSIALGQTGRAALTLGGTSNPEAQDLVLKVIHDFSDSEADLNRQLTLVDAALSLDPNYAEAYARKAFLLSAMAGTYARTAEISNKGQAEALATSNRAIAIAPGMALGYANRAFVFQQRLEIGAAVADSKRATALSGENVEVLSGYAFLLCLLGQSGEALQLMAKIISLDPLNPGSYSLRAVIAYYARRFSDAVGSARRSLALEPSQERMLGFLGDALINQGQTAAAEAEYRKIGPGSWRRPFGEAIVAARAHQPSQAEEKLKAMENLVGDTAHYQYGEIYAQLGLPELAFNELNLAWEVRDPGLAALRVDPFLDPLRRDPRLGALEHKLGLG